uniref:Fe2OG dioxygenase domain-containing protein n=1 Tax=Alexandrium monilatum TaxID=311494 RepID=A0A7S4RE98_9DINO
MAGREEKIRSWAASRIGNLLQMPADQCSEIVENILAYDDKQELKDFLGAFAEKAAEYKVNNFVEDLFEWRGDPKQARQADKQAERAPAGRGGAAGRGAGGGGRGGGRQGGRGGGREEEASGGKGKGRKEKEEDQFPKLDMVMRPRAPNDKRLMVIDAASGRHKVLTNCLNCGKVIAEEEGWGPCLFCGNPLEVGDRYGMRHGDDRGFLESVGRGTEEEEKFNESFEKAKATKDRLLSYDRDAKKRTRVFDDATDWYSESMNPWLSEKQREEALQQASNEERRKREERRRVHATIDIFGRTVISNDAEVAAEGEKKNRERIQEWTETVHDKNKLLDFMSSEQHGMSGANNQLSGDSKQLYDKLRASLHASGRDHQGSAFGGDREGGGGDKDDTKKGRWDASVDSQRVQDEFADVSVGAFAQKAENAGPLLPAEESPYGDADDTGQCLSMHQPWASLLVHGFKRAEGRSWKTDHRGRLWIHAAAKQPDQFEVDTLEQQYKSIYEARGIPTPPLPSQSGGYPTSALLGCVDVEEVWTNEQYMEVLRSHPAMPEEENSNEHIFWCLRPRRLVVPLRMGGESLIWRLPKPQLAAAQRGLRPVRWPAPAAGESPLTSPEITRAPSAPSAPSTAPAAGGSKRATGNAEAPTAAATDASRPTAPAAAPPRLDLWPAERPSEMLEVLERDREGADRDVVVLQNGFVHLVGFVPPDMQQRMVDELRELGLSERGFFAEHFDGIKVSTGVTRMYLGSHWNAVAQRWEDVRGNLDKEKVLDMPKFFVDMYVEAVKRANRELKGAQNKKRKLVPFPEGKPPTIGVANYYPASASMQIHQDKTESKEAIDAGYPVMGVCLGDTCDFNYANEAPSGGRKPKTLRLESGDVYLFGGESRLLWHGVGRILPRTAPPSLRLLPGRLSLTLRVR